MNLLPDLQEDNVCLQDREPARLGLAAGISHAKLLGRRGGGATLISAPLPTPEIVSPAKFWAANEGQKI